MKTTTNTLQLVLETFYDYFIMFLSFYLKLPLQDLTYQANIIFPHFMINTIFFKVLQTEPLSTFSDKFIVQLTPIYGPVYVQN